MNSFEEMGNAILLANEGERQIAEALLQWFTASAAKMRKTFSAQGAKLPVSAGKA